MALPETDLEARFAAVVGDPIRDTDVVRRKRIFCNRNLRMASIKMIGFDMDYTLARYHQGRMEELSIRLTLDKLIENHGYPPEIRALRYDPRFAIRGLVVDKKLGNIFKMDRHGHIGRVYHGAQRLNREQRLKEYRNQRVRLHLPRYKWIDTLFGLPEAVMYSTLVDYFDARGGGPSYDQLFTEIRNSIDEAHRDGTLKSTIKAHVADYIQHDPGLAETLHKLRSAGKHLFLLTNSYYDYTKAVMSYLLDGARAAYPSWQNYFDVIIVGGAKPGFFSDEPPFLELDRNTGEVFDRRVEQLSRGHIYQGGNIFAFEQMSGAKGDEVLYVGDHIYGDILRLKKTHVWRTCMVVQELSSENAISDRLEQEIRDLSLLDRRQRNLNSEIDYNAMLLKALQKFEEEAENAAPAPLMERVREARRATKDRLDRLRGRHRMISAEVDALEQTVDQAYNPHWGAVFREGNENSRFGEQVSDYADLYTSIVSNFLSYSPLRYFRAPRVLMPHEL